MGVAVRREWVEEAREQGWKDEPADPRQADTAYLRELLLRVREGLSKTRELSRSGRVQRAA